MSSSQSSSLPETREGGMPGLTWQAVAEWAIWVSIAALAWSQTGNFDDPIPGFELGATTWPNAVCLMIVLGATGQLAMRVAQRGGLARPGTPAPDRSTPDAAPAQSWARWMQSVAIFALPFLFIWLAPLMGFYLTAPLFVIALMLLLEVRSPLAILGVAATVWTLLLVIFTRFFYVALPVGQWDPFYEINASIIDIARLGL